MFKLRQTGLAAYYQPDSMIAEQYRAIRTNLEFGLNGQNVGVLLITSPEVGDGKTTTTTNLAYLLAQQGKRVLIVDADIRKPDIHRTFNLDNAIGLTDVLHGRTTFKDAIRQTEIPKLDVLTSGTTLQNSSELLSSVATKTFIKDVKRQYDTVLIDVPPVLDATDARVVAHLCDSVIIVICKGKTKQQYATESIRVLQFVKANIAGVILNERT